MTKEFEYDFACLWHLLELLRSHTVTPIKRKWIEEALEHLERLGKSCN